MNKVTIEITEHETVLTLKYNNKKYITKEVQTRLGSRRDDKPINEIRYAAPELYEHLEDFSGLGIMNALSLI